MAQVFYRVTSGEPLDFCRDFKVRHQAKMAEFGDYSRSKGGRGYVETWGFFGGIIFADDADIPTGLIADKHRTRDGAVVHKPGKRTAAGKLLRAEFDDLGRLPSSDEFCDRFGIPTSLTYRKSENHWGSMALHSGGFNTAQVLWVYDDFWLILPDIAAEISSKVAEGFDCTPAGFELPAGLERSTRARYDLAIAAAKVREEDEALAA